MLTQADIDNTPKHVRAAHHYRFACHSYSYRGWHGLLRYLIGRMRGIKIEHRPERIGNIDREGYKF